MKAEYILIIVAVIAIVAFIFLLEKKAHIFSRFEDDDDDYEDDDEYDEDEEEDDEEYEKTRALFSKVNKREEEINDDTNTYFSKIPNLDNNDKTKIMSAVGSQKEENLDETQLISMPEDVDTQVFGTVIYREHGKERKMPIKGEVICIGRDPEVCNIVISEDKFLGRQHALVYCKENTIYLVDLNSKNGTYVGNQRITGKVKIKVSQKVRLGSTELIIKVGE